MTLLDAQALAAAQSAHDAAIGQILGFVILAGVVLLAVVYNSTLPRQDRWL